MSGILQLVPFGPSLQISFPTPHLLKQFLCEPGLSTLTLVFNRLGNCYCKKLCAVHVCPLMVVLWESVVEMSKSLCYGCSVHAHTHTYCLSFSFWRPVDRHVHAHTHTHSFGNACVCWSLLKVRIRYSAGSYINTAHTCGRRLGSQQPLLLCVISLVCYYRPRLGARVYVCTHSHLGFGT